MKIALTIALTLVAFAFGVGGYTFFVACRRGKEIDWQDQAAVEKTPYGAFYPHIKEGHDWIQAHEHQDLYMTSHDGLKLHGIWCPAEHPRGTIILAHGYHSCYLTDFGVAYDMYHNQGMNLLLIEQRAHGESEGKYTTFGVLESRDLLDWAKLHNEMFGPLPLVFSGLSMGASTVMYLEDMPKNTRGRIADCGFTSPKEIIGQVFKNTTHIPAWPFLWAADLFARFFAGFSLSQKDTTKTLAKNTLPIILVHGTDDDFVPCDMTRRSYAACTGEKELLLVEGASHGVSFIKAREEYIALVHAFIERCVEDPT